MGGGKEGRGCPHTFTLYYIYCVTHADRFRTSACAKKPQHPNYWVTTNGRQIYTENSTSASGWKARPVLPVQRTHDCATCGIQRSGLRAKKHCSNDTFRKFWALKISLVTPVPRQTTDLPVLRYVTVQSTTLRSVSETGFPKSPSQNLAHCTFSCQRPTACTFQNCLLGHMFYLASMTKAKSVFFSLWFTSHVFPTFSLSRGFWKAG